MNEDPAVGLVNARDFHIVKASAAAIRAPLGTLDRRLNELVAHVWKEVALILCGHFF